MMNSRIFLAVGLLLASGIAQARSGNLQRGGLGFLFPDHNSFANPGQFATSHGMAVEADYSRTNQPGFESAGPSMVYGSGKFGFGVFGKRIGGDLTPANSTDVVGAGIGFGLLKQRLTIGASFVRELETNPSSEGQVRGTLTFNSAQRKGPSIGIAYAGELKGSNQKSGTIGFGYQFRSNASMELNVDFRDLQSFSDWVAGGFFNVGGGSVYLGAGYRSYKLVSNEAVARLGFVLGSSIDLSVSASHIFESGSPVFYGGSFRASF